MSTKGEYEEGRLWFKRKGEIVTVGLTHAGADALGAVERVELPEEGDDYIQGDVVALVEGTRGQVEIVCPAAGYVEAVNEALRGEPEAVVDDPLEEGWIVRFEIEDPADLVQLGDGSLVGHHGSSGSEDSDESE